MWASCRMPNLREQRSALVAASCLHCRYEDEINKRTNAENDFVVLKKVRGRGGVLGELRIGEEKTPGWGAMDRVNSWTSTECALPSCRTLTTRGKAHCHNCVLLGVLQASEMEIKLTDSFPVSREGPGADVADPGVGCWCSPFWLGKSDSRSRT